VNLPPPWILGRHLRQNYNIEILCPKRVSVFSKQVEIF
jgi:hypothetical protein